MKNSIRSNTTRQTTTFEVTLVLVLVLAVSGVTGILPDPTTDAAGSGKEKRVTNISPRPDGATREQITEAFGKLPMRFEAKRGN